MKKILIASAALIALLGVVPSPDSRTDQVADGSTTQFYFGFKTTDVAHLRVFVDGTPVPAYSAYVNVNQDSSPGGAVTFYAPPPAGAIVRIERTLPLTQDSVWSPYAAFKMKTLEGELDVRVMQLQQVKRQLDDLAATFALGGFPVPPNDGSCIGWVGSTLSNVPCGGGSGGADTRLPAPIAGRYVVGNASGGYSLVTFDQMLEAIASSTGQAPAGVTYFLDTSAPEPTFSPPPTYYNTTQSVTLATTAEGGVIHYTTDGSAPSCSSLTYETPLTVSAVTTIKAITCTASGGALSSVSSATYTISLPTVWAPTFSPGAGTYATTQSVHIFEYTGSAEVRYTLDGTDPTCSTGTVYDQSGGGEYLSIATTTTLKAIGCRTGFQSSSVTTAVYSIVPQVAAPTYSPDGGPVGSPVTFTSTPTVTISTTTPSAVIRYSTDGNAPTCTSGLSYTAPFPYSGGLQPLMAIACRNGYANSDVTARYYTVSIPTVATPTASPAAGTYASGQSVTFSTATGGATIRYTTDGVQPTCGSGTIYSGAIAVPGPGTTYFRVIACAAGLADSAIANFAYAINLPQATAPTFSPAPGQYGSAQTVTVTTTQSGGVTHYTTDGTTPTCSSTTYSSPISVPTTATLKALTCATGFLASSVTSGTYTIGSDTLAPTWPETEGFACTWPNGGMTTDISAVSATDNIAVTGYAFELRSGGSYSACATPPAIGAFSTDASYPAALTAGAVGTYVACGWARDLAGNISAYSFCNNGVGGLRFGPVVATPSISPSGGSYSSAQTVTITDGTAGASIFYTTDGTYPACTAGGSTLAYSAPFTVSTTSTVTAKACKTDYNPSASVAASYTITGGGSHSAPTLVGSTAVAYSTSGGLTPTLPTVQAGDLLVIVAAYGVPWTPGAAPAGWTRTVTPYTNAMEVLTRIATGSDSAPTLPTDYSYVQAAAFALRGVSASTPIDVVGVSASGPTVPSVTTVTDHALVVTVGRFDDAGYDVGDGETVNAAGTTFGTPTGAAATPLRVAANVNGVITRGLGIWYGTQAAVGATGTGGLVIDSPGNISTTVNGVSFAIRPQ